MADSDNDSGGGENNGSSDKEENRLLPLANVSRIMKNALPANAKIPKEAKEMVQECASEFISFITSGASDKCLREKRKTINGDDLLWAMSTLGFDDYIDPLKLYLYKFRELEGDKQGIGSGAPGNGGSASSPLSQPTDVLGGGGNVGGRYGAGLYGTGTDSAGSGWSGMINMVLMDQQLYGGAPGGGGSASSSISSQPTDVLGGGGNVGGSYGAGFYGTGTGGAGCDGSGMMVMGKELYGGSPMSRSLYQHQQHQLGSGLFPGNSGSGRSGGGSGRSSSPSGRRKDMI